MHVPPSPDRGGSDAVAHLASTRARLLRAISDAAGRADRDPTAVEIVAITKTVPPAQIVAAVEAGFRTLGENRVQERQAKAAELGADGVAPGTAEAGPSPSWHLVGPLQSNKARRAVELFDVIESVDSLDLATRLDRLAAELRPGRLLEILLQVNVDVDVAKSGFEPPALARDLRAILELPNLSVAGLMTVGRLVQLAEDARPTFRALRALSEDLRARHAGLGTALSMGMTEDFEVAIEEGATLVRIGRAIFGTRPTVR